ncbi:hypothetical protein ABW19_dt0202389 [Dactylella cylindrospora]|nr:hypothetical protein ABW19_dt0202389 [Dactylella cylindrospora]
MVSRMFGYLFLSLPLQGLFGVRAAPAGEPGSLAHPQPRTRTHPNSRALDVNEWEIISKIRTSRGTSYCYKTEPYLGWVITLATRRLLSTYFQDGQLEVLDPGSCWYVVEPWVSVLSEGQIPRATAIQTCNVGDTPLLLSAMDVKATIGRVKEDCKDSTGSSGEHVDTLGFRARVVGLPMGLEGIYGADANAFDDLIAEYEDVCDPEDAQGEERKPVEIEVKVSVEIEVEEKVEIEVEVEEELPARHGDAGPKLVLQNANGRYSQILEDMVA